MLLFSGKLLTYITSLADMDVVFKLPCRFTKYTCANIFSLCFLNSETISIFITFLQDKTKRRVSVLNTKTRLEEFVQSVVFSFFFLIQVYSLSTRMIYLGGVCLHTSLLKASRVETVASWVATFVGRLFHLAVVLAFIMGFYNTDCLTEWRVKCELATCSYLITYGKMLYGLDIL